MQTGAEDTGSRSAEPEHLSHDASAWQQWRKRSPGIGELCGSSADNVSTDRPASHGAGSAHCGADSEHAVVAAGADITGPTATHQRAGAPSEAVTAGTGARPAGGSAPENSLRRRGRLDEQCHAQRVVSAGGQFPTARVCYASATSNKQVLASLLHSSLENTDLMGL